MNVLEYLAHKKTETLTSNSHPLAHNSATFKYNYCLGLGVLVYGYKDQLPITLECFSSILNSLHMDQEQRKKIPLQIRNNFDLKMTEVFQAITSKSEQYCFISDLYRLSFFGLISPTYCHDIIEGYTQVFHFTASEKEFLKEFTTLGFQTASELEKRTLSYYDTKLEQAVKLYQNFKSAGYDISTSILEYIYPSFSLTNEIEDFVLDDGSIQRFESNLRIRGNMIISNCSTVIFDHAKVKLDGKIIVKNGKILIKHSDIFIERCTNDYALTIEEAPAIRIEDTTIDCNHQAGFLNQNCGHLKLQHCNIKNTCNHYGIYFTGNSAEISTTVFENCDNGALFNHAIKELFIGSSTFVNCKNIHGGAIHSRSIANTTIYNCNFHNCHAQYIGGAVYFVNLKYGQSVINCNFENCTPPDSALFNVYSNRSLDLY